MNGNPFESPFPRTLADGRVIVDEMCACGQPRSRHEASAFGAFGHGHCGASTCKRFTWVAMVFQKGRKRK